jgi:hypothetical protein
VAIKQAQAGDFRAALKNADGIEDAAHRASALKLIAAAQARAGRVTEALETAKVIDDDEQRATAFGMIAAKAPQ